MHPLHGRIDRAQRRNSRRLSMNRRTFLGVVGSSAVAVSGCNAFSGGSEEFPGQGTVSCGADASETTTPASQSSLTPVEGSWPTTYYDAQLTAYNPDATPPRSCPQVQWRSRIEVQAEVAGQGGRWDLYYDLHGSPAVVDGSCYVCDVENEFYAFDAATGQERWRKELNRSGSQGVSVVDNVAYFGNGPSVRAIDLIDRTERWHATPPQAELNTNSTKFSPTTAPTVGMGSVCVGTVGGLVQAFDASTGRLQWQYDVVEDPPEPVDWRPDDDDYEAYPSVGAPAIAGERVYAGDLTGAVTAFDRPNGDRQWRTQLNTLVNGGLAVAGDSVYVTTLTDLYRLSRETGQIIWALSDTFESDTAGPGETPATKQGIHVLGQPAIATDFQSAEGSSPDGLVYLFAAQRGRPRQVRAVDMMTGSVEWTAPVSTSWTAGISVGGDVVLANAGDYAVAMDRYDGSVLWGIEVSHSTDTCALVGDAVFISDFAGYVYGIA